MIQLPENVYFVIRDSTSSQIERVSVASVTCKCPSSNGCSPVERGGEYYCVMELGCDTCTTVRSKTNGETVPLLVYFDSC